MYMWHGPCSRSESSKLIKEMGFRCRYRCIILVSFVIVYYALRLLFHELADSKHTITEIVEFLDKRHAVYATSADQNELIKGQFVLPAEDVEYMYYAFLDHIDDADEVVQFCSSNNIRFAGEGEGSWITCKLKMDSNCLVYSFGIGNDWRFEDEITRTYGCRLRAFDPSMPYPDHNRSKLIDFYKTGLSGDNTDSIAAKWQLRTLRSYRSRFNELERPIDVLKVDIELAEWNSLHTALRDGSLSNVVQLITEVHTDEVFGAFTHHTSLLYYLDILYSLRKAGFVKWRAETNYEGVQYHSRATHRSRPCCAQLYFVNRNHYSRLS